MGVSRKGQKAEATETEKSVRTRRRTNANLVSSVIKKIGDRLDKDELKPTVGDLLRLLEVEKEMKKENEQPREIKVSWVEADQKEHAPEE